MWSEKTQSVQLTFKENKISRKDLSLETIQRKTESMKSCAIKSLLKGLNFPRMMQRNM